MMLMNMFKTVFCVIFSFNAYGLSSFDKAMNEASNISFSDSKEYTQNYVLDFQERVVDEMYKKLIDDKSFTLKTGSKEFKEYVRAIGFLSKYSKDHNAASYVAEITEKLKITVDVFWKKAGTILPGPVMNKLKADYKIETNSQDY